MMWRPLSSRWPLRRLTVPHVCAWGHQVAMQRSAVRYAREARWMLRCPALGCDGYLWPAPTPDGETLRQLLTLAANTVVPADDGLERIRVRIAAATPRRPWWRRLITRITKSAAAPGCTPGAAACADGWKEPNDMTRSIPRRAHKLCAGDIITHDPDHDRAVRWRVSAPPKVNGSGVALIDYTDLNDGAEPGNAWFDGLVELAVEPVGGAQ
ncbi:hypothetical protein [Actinomadura rubrisoli]|uniref:Uncharacterized protein n=1 Tax=Actinomadura rubrisoli TaxID=2530368 RepID=A0A4R5AZP7_9ACTN|nr:hypothetical protein [Actinomadura rubrisoli]TDD77709.1 hypothetical protein E1298_29715 [Actinomadura rubrisoli]